MGLFSKNIATIDDLWLHGLKDIYYAEKQIVKSLPKLIDKSTNCDLTKSLSDDVEETRKQISRLDQRTTNLNEEKAADKKLSTVALRKGMNRWAVDLWSGFPQTLQHKLF